MCAGNDAVVRKLREMACDAGALDVIVVAMRTFIETPQLLEQACRACINICQGTDIAARIRKQHAAELSLLAVTVSPSACRPR